MTEPGKEQVFVEQYAECVGATAGAVIVVTDLTSGVSSHLASTRVDPSYTKVYDEYYHSVNVYLQRAKRMLTHNVVQPGHAICPHDELVRTEYYNDYMRPQRIHHSLGIATPLGGGLYIHLGACRPKSQGTFNAEETAVAEAIAAHLSSVMQVRERFLGLQGRTAALSYLTDELPFGVLLLSAAGKVLETNRRAAGILRAADGLSVKNGELSAAFPPEASALRKLVGRVMATSRGGGLEADRKSVV